MFIFNVKVNGSKLFKGVFYFYYNSYDYYFVYCFFIRLFLVLIRVFLFLIIWTVLVFVKFLLKNYTNILKTVHENIDNYVGKKN